MGKITTTELLEARTEAKRVLERGDTHCGSLRLYRHIDPSDDSLAICGPVEPVLMAVHRFGCEAHGIMEVAAAAAEDVKGYPCPLCWAAGARVVAGPEMLAPRPRS